MKHRIVTNGGKTYILSNPVYLYSANYKKSEGYKHFSLGSGEMKAKSKKEVREKVAKMYNIPKRYIKISKAVTVEFLN